MTMTDNEAKARIIVTLRNAIPAIIAALEVAERVLDEDWCLGDGCIAHDLNEDCDDDD